MRKNLFAAVVAMGIMVPGVALAGIASSAHDFSDASGFDGDNWNSGNDQICQPCHTPHNAKTGIADAPLWNHESSISAYTLYSGFSIDHTPGAPAGISKLCLGCHDGTVALEDFGGVTTGIVMITGSKLVGTDLSGNHPISFTYSVASGADAEIYVGTTATPGGTIDSELLNNTDRMECSSCHDVHNTANGGLNSFLLRIDNANSALCLACHDK